MFGDSKNDLIFKNHIKKVPFGTFLLRLAPQTPKNKVEQNHNGFVLN